MEWDTEEVITSHMALAQSIAHQVWRTAPHALDLDELRAIAYLGLVAATNRWLPYCVTPETPVLTAGLNWVRADSLVVGDEVVGVDEYPTAGRDRKYRRASVLAAGLTLRPCAEITFHDGRQVRSSLDHPWLAVRPVSARQAKLVGAGGSYSWVETAKLRRGDRVCAPLRVWPDDDSFDTGWLAGMLDGEGCLVRDPRRVISSGETGANMVFIAQNEGPIFDRVKQVLASLGIPFQVTSVSPEGKVRRAGVTRRSAAIELLGRVRPFRLNASRLWENASIYTRHGIGQHTAYIESIEPIGDHEVVALETTTRTYIANGLVAHNCAEKGHDPARVEYFKTFASRRIYGSLIDAIRAADFAPRSLRTRAKALRDAGQDKGLSHAELAERTGMTVAEVRSTVRGMAQKPVSLEAEELEPTAEHDVESSAFIRLVLAEVIATVDSLDLGMQVVLCLHYFKGLQLQQVAKAMGIPEAKASQMHADAVTLVHNAMVSAAQQRTDE